MRFPYTACALAGLALCVLIAAFMGSFPFIRGFVGDAVVVCLLYCAIKSVLEVEASRLAPAVMLFAYGVEALQYLDMPRWAGWQHIAFTRMVFGAVFDPMDLLAYTLGAVAAYLLDTKLLQPAAIRTDFR